MRQWSGVILVAKSLRIPFNAGSGTLVLGFLAIVSIIRGVCYFPAIIPESHHIPALEAVAPIAVWSIVWFFGGFIAFIGVFWDRFSNIGVGVVSGLHALWGCLYLIAYLLGQSERGYVTAVSFFTVSFLVIACFTRYDRDKIFDWINPGVRHE